jgi:glycosyltransferase involved in cell wall biosynthesis
VFTLHDYFLACPNGGFFDHSSGRVCHKPAMGLRCLTTQCDARNGAHKAWRVAREAVLWSAGRMPRGLREVIYLMPKQRSIMGGYLARDTRWHLLHNPVAGSPQERVRVEENDAFLFVGRLSPEKGAVLAARAARLAGVRIVFAGEGEDREAVRRANPDAELLGWLDAEELGRWMARARCLVFPSVWYEGFGLVVADALRMGVPVLVSDSTVATDMVSDGVNGLHVAAGDVEAWARAMTRMAPDDTARAFGEAAFRAGKRLMGYEEYTDRLIGIYESVLARRQAGSALGEVATA